MGFAEVAGWAPPEPARVWAWEEVPELARRYAAGEVEDYFPVFGINPV